MPRRSRWARVARVLVRVLVATAVALIGAVGVGLYLLDSPRGHRWAAKKVEALVSEAIPGSLSIGRVQKLTPARIVAGDIVVRDRAGAVVLEVSEVEALPDLPALIRGVVGIRELRIRGAHAALQPGEDEVFTLVEAF